MKRQVLLLFLIMVPVLATNYLESPLPIWMEKYDTVTTNAGYEFEVIAVEKAQVQLKILGIGIRSVNIDDIVQFHHCRGPIDCSYFVWLTEIYNDKARLRVATNYEDFGIVNQSKYRINFPDLPCYPTPYNRSYYEGEGRYSLKVGDAISLNNLTLVFVMENKSANLEVYDYENCDFIDSIEVKINQSWSKSFQDLNLMISGYGYGLKAGGVDLFIISQELAPWDFWRLILWVGLILVVLVLIFGIVFRWKKKPEVIKKKWKAEKVGEAETPFMTMLEEKSPVPFEEDETENENKETDSENEKTKNPIKLISKFLSSFNKGKN